MLEKFVKALINLVLIAILVNLLSPRLDRLLVPVLEPYLTQVVSPQLGVYFQDQALPIDEISWALAIIAAVVPLLVLNIALETKHLLAWNWRWHRFWYELGLRRRLQRWQHRFGILHAEPRISPQVLVDGKPMSLVVALQDEVRKKNDQTGRCLVLGEPGSGKTTGLERLALDLSEHATNRLGFGGRIPLLARLSDYQQGTLMEYLADELARSSAGGSGAILAGGFKKLLQGGHIALLLDGLDEAFGDRQNEAIAEIRKLFRDETIKRIPIVITSRTREYQAEDIRYTQELVIQDLEDDVVSKFIDVYNESNVPTREIYEQLQDQNLLGKGELGRNPFWLRLIVEHGGLQATKGRILAQAVDDLLQKEWNRQGRDKAMWKRRLAREIQLTETRLALSFLAFEMVKNREVRTTEDEACNRIDSWLGKRPGLKELTPQDIIGLGRDANLLTYRPGPLRYRHRLIQDFMAADALAREPESAVNTFILDNVQENYWQSVIAMLDGTHYRLLSYLHKLLSSATSTDSVRLSVIEVLADIGSSECPEIISNHLTNSTPSSTVIDASWNAFGRIGRPALRSAIKVLDFHTRRNADLRRTSRSQQVATPITESVLQTLVAICKSNSWLLLPSLIDSELEIGTRSHLLEVAVRMGDRAVPKLLLDVANDGDLPVELRRNAIHSFISVSEVEAIDALDQLEQQLRSNRRRPTNVLLARAIYDSLISFSMPSAQKCAKAIWERWEFDKAESKSSGSSVTPVTSKSTTPKKFEAPWPIIMLPESGGQGYGSLQDYYPALRDLKLPGDKQQVLSSIRTLAQLAENEYVPKSLSGNIDTRDRAQSRLNEIVGAIDHLLENGRVDNDVYWQLIHLLETINNVRARSVFAKLNAGY